MRLSVKNYLTALFLLITTALCAQLPDRYGPVFYGIELPDTGANVLLIVDSSGSMRLNDYTRQTPGTRWDTLCDEVETMTEQMAELCRYKGVGYTVTVLYEGGYVSPRASDCYNLKEDDAGMRLVAELKGRFPGGSASFDETFGKLLWPLVAKHHVTHIFYLGDDDIGRYSVDNKVVQRTIKSWYTLPKKNPRKNQQRLWKLKQEWWSPWKRWRKPTPGVPVFKSQMRMPPPPKNVKFSCIVIGESSEILKEIAKRGGGEYVEKGNSQ